MTVLAYDCVMLEIPVDPLRLFEKDDRDAEVWLAQVVKRVRKARLEEQQRQEAKMRQAGGRR